MRYPLANKVVLLTGASSGIGKATARALHARGAYLVLIARREEILAELAHELSPRRTLAIAADVTDSAGLEAAVTAGVERFGGVDVAIANAGTAVDPPTTIAAVDEHQFERVIEVDLLGVWRTVRAALPQIIARQGHVVLTASVYSYLNGVANAAYATAKGGVEQLGRALRVELAPHGASAGVLYPGWTQTPLVRAAFGGNAVATGLLEHVYPRPFRIAIAPERVAAATVRGIEWRSASITVPGRWIPVSILRGIVNPVIDRLLEHDPAVRQGVLELERPSQETVARPEPPRASSAAGARS